MAESFMLVGDHNGYRLATGTTYIPVANCGFFPSATQDYRKVRQRTAGAYKKMFCRVLTNSRASDTTLKFFRYDGSWAQVGDTLTIGVGVEDVWIDASLGATTINDGDYVVCEIVTAGAGNIDLSMVGFSFTPTDTALTVVRHAALNFPLLIGTTTGWMGITDHGSALGLSATESETQFPLRVVVTMKNMYGWVGVWVGVNTIDATCTKDGATTDGLTLSPTGTGEVEDTSSSWASVDGTLVGYELAHTGAGSMQFEIIAVEEHNASSGRSFHAMYGATYDGFEMAGGQTRYGVWGGGQPTSVETGEGNVQMEMPFAGTVGRLCYCVMDNTIA